MNSISVVIPTYNCAQFLPQAVESALGQSCVAEIVVVDDGSTDATADYMATVADRVRYLRQDNGGPAAARNRGVDVAGGELVAFLDADDVWLPGALAQLQRPLQDYPDVALVTADKSIIDARGEVIIPSWYARKGLLDTFVALNGTPIPNALATLAYKNFVNTSVVLVRRGAFQQVGGFDPAIRFGEDLELWARIAARYSLIALPQTLGLYRQHLANATRNTEAMFQDLIRVMQKMRTLEGAQLMAQGVDPDRLVAQAWHDLGYWHFARGEHAQSRKAFLRSFREKPSRRAAAYALASSLPAGLTGRLRQIKWSVTGDEE